MAYHDYDQGGQQRDQVSWNIASRQANHISTLVEKATRFYLTGDIGNWYWHLTALREMMNCDLKEEERKILDDYEREASGYYKNWNVYMTHVKEGVTPPQEIKKTKANFSAIVRIYQRKIMDLLKELGYLPSKEDRTKLSF